MGKRGIELATAYVTLAVSTDDLAQLVAKQFGQVEKTVAPQAGAKIGKAMSKGFDTNKPDVAKLQDDFDRTQQKIVAAQKRATTEQENLSRKVEIAEAKKAEAVEKYGEKSSRTLSVVDQLKLAEQRLEAATMKAKSEQDKFNTELDQAEQKLTDAKKSSEKLGDSFKDIDSTSGKAGSKLGDLSSHTEKFGDAGQDASQKWGKLSDAIGSTINGDFSGAFGSLMPSAEGAASGVEGVLGGMGKGGAGKFSGAFVAGLGLLGGLVAAAGIGVAVSDAITDGMDAEKTAYKVQASLGLTPKDAEKYADTIASIYGSGLGESKEQASEAVDSLLSSFPKLKIDDSALDGASKKLLALNEAFEMDLPSAAQTASQLVQNGIAKDLPEAFDLIAAGMQKVPKALRDEYTDALEEYTPHLANLGYTGKEAFGILASSTEMGKYGIDKAGDALKEFSIRATDMSKTSVGAYDLMGLSAEDMSNKLLAGGEDAREATGEIVDGLLSIKDPTEQANAAIALFGTPLEDLGVNNIPKFLKGLDSAGDSLGNVKGKADDVTAALQGGASESVERFSRGFENLKSNVGTKLLDGLYAVTDWVSDVFGPAFSTIGDGIEGIFSLLGEGEFTDSFRETFGLEEDSGVVEFLLDVHDTFVMVGDTISDTWDGTIYPALETMWAFVQDTLAPVFNALWTDVIQPVWSNIALAIGIAWDTIAPILGGLWSFITDTLAPVFVWLWDTIVGPTWTLISGAIGIAWSIISPIFGAINNFIGQVLAPTFVWLRDSIIIPVWDFIGEKISNVWNLGIKPVFEALKSWVDDKIAPAFGAAKTAVEKAWDGIKDAVKEPVNFIINTVWNNGIVGLFNKAAKHLPGAPQIKEFHPDGFWSGGWTGPGERLQAAGVVHADEFVIRKSSRKKIEDSHPGLLNHMNSTGMVGYADGGKVEKMIYPTSASRISSGFGTARGGGSHAGIDFPVPVGTDVHAALAGKVIRAAWNAVTGRTGKGMLLEHSGNRNTYYGHLSSFVASVGQAVKQGQTIAKSGNTGQSTGPHLHFETWSGGKPLNPAQFLAGAALPAAMQSFMSGWGSSSEDQLPALLAPFEKLFSKLDSIGNSDWGKVVKSAGKKLINMPIQWIKEHIGDLSPIQKLEGTGALVDSAVVKHQVQSVAEKYGWGSGPQWNAIDWIVQKESGWNPKAANPTSSARGLFQQMTSIHGPVASTPAGQAEWGLNYIKSRYGTPTQAQAFWKAHNWYEDGGRVTPHLYDGGGWLQPGDSLTRNLTRKPEAVLTNEQWRIVERKIVDAPIAESLVGKTLILKIGEKEVEAVIDERVDAGIDEDRRWS